MSGWSNPTRLLGEMVSEKVAEEGLVKLRSSHVDPLAVNELELRARLFVLNEVELHVRASWLMGTCKFMIEIQKRSRGVEWVGRSEDAPWQSMGGPQGQEEGSVEHWDQ